MQQSIYNPSGSNNLNSIRPLFADNYNDERDSFYDLIHLISNLPRIDKKLVVSDLDDTLLPTTPRLQLGVFQDKRGDEGNDYIRNEFGGYDKYVEEFVFKELLVKQILDIVKNDTSMILTAGVEELQYKKINKVGLSDIPIVVVERSHQKPIVLLKYIISLGYIPSSIHIYDDRTEHFKLWVTFLSKILYTQINVFDVTLKGNKIDNIEKESYGDQEPVIMPISTDILNSNSKAA